MDPVTVLGLIATIGDIVTIIYDYGSAVKGAGNDIASLSKELFALRGVLEHIKAQERAVTKSSSGDSTGASAQLFGSKEFKSMLRYTNDILQELLCTLEIPKGKFKKAVHKLSWPFTKEDVDAQVASLERVKTWFILAMMTDSLSVTQKIFTEVSQIAKAIKEEHKDRHQSKNDAAKQEVLRWLAPVNPEALHHKACKARQPGTGQWFLEGPLVSWQNAPTGRKPLLWLKGKSGAGKTTLIAYAIENVISKKGNDPSAGIAYFYCAFDNADSQQPASVLGALAAQLAAKNPAMLEEFRLLYEREKSLDSSKKPEMAELEAVTVKHLAAFSSVFLFIDALNESAHCDTLIHLLLRLLKSTKNLHVLVSSIVVAETTPAAHYPDMTEVDMKFDAVKEDIKVFTEARLKEDTMLAGLSDKLKADIRRVIIDRASGSFRFARMQIDHLSSQRTGRLIREALQQMPVDLNSTYVSMLKRISPADRVMARRALLWLSFSSRPLYLSELCEAVVLEKDDTSLDNDSRLQQPHLVLDICKGLADYNVETRQVTLAHSSIKTFLTSEAIRTSPASFYTLNPQWENQTIMRKCLRYLLFTDFRNGESRADPQTGVYWHEFPLLSYATVYWLRHVSREKIEARDWELISRFFDTRKLPNGGNYACWLRHLLQNPDPKTVERTEPLYYAASYGSLPLVKKLVETDSTLNINATGGRYGDTPLHIAMYRKHYDVAKFLQQAGADPRPPVLLSLLQKNKGGETA
ncbi:hypothetical protein H2199_006386 [Coniosporium tulheliwenetii]|uniref:Uncharacterized protein n=1 Tax=Coniosporium tulheliwenetii TaxID=3383036 RepID=A0ACC2YVF9_9PEZI|nr:hypothetical protein H2199_006386 [Cladosporium sp. JES 115]